MSDTQASAQNLSESTKHYHLIPLNSGDEQPILPISREYLSTDCAVFYPYTIGHTHSGLNKLAQIVGEMLGHNTSITRPLDSTQDAYTTAYQDLREYLNKDTNIQLWINVAGTSSECASAFSQAATTLQIESPDHRPDINVYTVAEDGTPEPIGCAPSGKPTSVGKTILYALLNGPTPESITALARQMCDGDMEAAFKSKIQYNVKKLEKQGYIERKGDTRMRPLLTPTGEMWAQTHNK